MYDDDTGVQQAVPDVAFSVRSSAGDEIGTGETDRDGVFLIEVPGPGEYEVTIDPSTFPSGVTLIDPSTVSRTVDVSPNETQRILFALQFTGPDEDSTSSPDASDTSDAAGDDKQMGIPWAIAAAAALVTGAAGWFLGQRSGARRGGVTESRRF